MNDLEFRAWLEREKKMVSVREINFAGEQISFETDDSILFASFDEIKLMQWIGLRDNTRTEEFPEGKEIFEGDIVQIKDDWDTYGMNAGEIYEVYFNAGGFRLKPKYDVYKRGARGFWLDDGNDVTVLGNVYENPELLEKIQ